MKNYIHQSSFTNLNCPSANGAFCSYNGIIQINQTNITKCKDAYYSSFQIYPYNNSIIATSQFKNNTATYSNGLYLSYSLSSISTKLYQCNVITQYCGAGNGIIYVNNPLTIDSCVIKDNFAGDKYLILNSGIRIYATNSYINNLDAPYYSGSVPVITKSIANSEEMSLDLYTTANCQGTRMANGRILCQHADYTQYVMKLCETFLNKNYKGSPDAQVNSYYILFADPF